VYNNILIIFIIEERVIHHQSQGIEMVVNCHLLQLDSPQGLL